MKLVYSILLTLLLFISASSQIKIWQANVQHGSGTDDVPNYTRQANILIGSSADIVFMQERSTGDPGWNSPMVGFTERIYLENDAQQGDGPSIWTRNSTVTPGTGSWGTSVYSHKLSNGFVGWDGSTTVDKAAVAIDAIVNGVRATIVSTHLCWSACADSNGSQYSAKRVSQINELFIWIATLPQNNGNILIGGDLNLAPDYPKNPSGLQIDLFTANYQDAWEVARANGTATASWGDRNSDGVPDMPISNLLTRTHDTRRIDYFFVKTSAPNLTITSVDMPDLRATCPHALVAGGAMPSCSPEVVGGPGVSLQQWDIEDDFGVRPSDHNFLLLTLNQSFTTPLDPSRLRLNSTSSGKTTLYWDDNSFDETSFRIERCSGVGCSAYVEIGSTGANVTSYSDLTTSGNAVYFYRVRARNGTANSGYTSEIDVKTPAVGRTLTTIKIFPVNPEVRVGEDIVLVCVAYDASNGRFKNIAPTWNITDGTKVSLRAADEDKLLRNYVGSTGWDYGSSPDVGFGMSYHYGTMRGLATGTTTISATIEGVTSVSRTILVKNPTTAPTATLGGDLTNGSTFNIKVGEQAYVDASNSLGLKNITITWGDGFYTTEETRAVHVYTTTGNKTVTLTITNSSGTSTSTSATVAVSAQPAPAATCSAATPAQVLSCYSTLSPTGGRINITATIASASSLVFGSRNPAHTEYIEVMKSGATLPDIQKRVDPITDNANLALFTASANNESPIIVDAGAHHLRFRGIRLEHTSTFVPATYFLARFGQPSAAGYDLTTDPHHIIVEHMVAVPQTPTQQIVHGVGVECNRISFISSYIGPMRSDSDSQAMFGLNGTGLHSYYNCFIQATGENLMYGGATLYTEGHVPYAIEFRRSYFPKDVAWIGNPAWQYKNLFEIKSARFVYVQSCIFEYEFSAAQEYAITTKSVNQSDDSPWAVGEYIRFEDCIIRHVASGLNTAWDQEVNDIIQAPPSLKPRFHTYNNILLDDVDNVAWGGSGHATGFNSASYISVNHLTSSENNGKAFLLYGNTNMYELEVKNSVFAISTYPIFRSGGEVGTVALNSETSNRFTFTKNLLVLAGGENPSDYPATNTYPTSNAGIQFTNFAGGDFSLSASSPGHLYATDGTDSGYNRTKILAETLHTIDGNWVVGSIIKCNWNSSPQCQ